MVPGVPNTYSLTPLVKMVIVPVKMKGDLTIDQPLKAFSVLYNPQSYRLNRYTTPHGTRTNEKGQQFPKFGLMETMDVDFFLDTFGAGAEVVGLDMMKPPTDALKFSGNSLLPSMGKQLDVSDYVKKIYDLSIPDASTHFPPGVKLVWDSLEFKGFLQRCSVEYTKFTETGMPVRATVHCTFVSATPLKELMGGGSFMSPDTSKFHTVQQGETIHTLSGIAYDDPALWRSIATANGITNPRLLRTGDVLHMPAIID